MIFFEFIEHDSMVITMSIKRGKNLIAGHVSHATLKAGWHVFNVTTHNNKNGYFVTAKTAMDAKTRFETNYKMDSYTISPCTAEEQWSVLHDPLRCPCI